MIDFSEYGSILVHDTFSKEGLTIQFVPHGSSNGRAANQRSMVALLDEYLKEKNIERTIMIQSAKNYPIPCVILRGVFNE